MIVTYGKCDCCHKHNSECMVFEKIVLWYFVTEVKLCKRCVAASFHMLNANRIKDYSNGSAGIVKQATSKSSPVTLNN